MFFRLLALFTILLAPAAAQTSDRQVLDEFLAWYKSYRGSFMPADVAKAYAGQLAAKGVAKPEIDTRLAAITKAVRAMPPEFTALHFDHIYQSEKPPFRTDPSRFLLRVIEGRKPGKALDVAMGQGRNSIYLASKGWDVTGYDLSEEGLAIANAAARRAGFTVKTLRSTHDDFDYGNEQWDLIVQTFAFTNLSDAAYRARLLNSLKPGGLLVIEGFGNPNREGPRNVLFDGFKNLRVLCYEDLDDVADWGLQKARLNRIAAEK